MGSLVRTAEGIGTAEHWGTKVNDSGVISSIKFDVSRFGQRVGEAVGSGPARVDLPSLGELEGGGTPKKEQRNLLFTIHSSSGPRSWLSLQVATCPASLAAEPGSGHVPGLDTRQGVTAGSSWVSLNKVSEDNHELSPQQA